MTRRFFSHFDGDTYQARAFRGAVLAVSGRGGQNLIRLLSNLVLTRLLFPEAFGLMALVQVVLAGTAMFSDLGIAGSILQNPRGKDPVFLNTAWTLQIVRGILLFAAVLILAEPLAEFYDAPQLAEILQVSAFVPLIQGFNSTRIATATREIQLGRVTAIALGAQVLGVLVMIALSFWLRSVWALVFGTLVQPLVVMLLSHILLKGPPNRLAFEREAFASLFSFGRFVFFATLAGFFVRQGDRAVLGKFVSLDDLAIYNIGFFLATVPTILSQQISDKVVYPLYARRPPAESTRNRKKINKARMLLTGGMVLAAVALAILGDWGVRLLYDSRYEAAGPVVIVVALASLPILIMQSYVKMPLANGQSGRFAIFSISRAILLMGLLLIMVPRFGLFGAAVAPGLTALLIYPLMVWIIAPYKGWDPRHDVIFGLLGAVLVAGVVWLHGDILATLLPAG